MPSIDLDCPPGGIRPNDLLPDVLKDTGLTPEDFDVKSKLFGNWNFQLKDNDEKFQTYQNVVNIIEERIRALYNRGRIRYGSW